MSEPETTQNTKQTGMNERCVCREVVDHLRECLGVSPDVREHFANSRIEFLKGIRAIIDSRIEHLSKAGQTGTKIAVE
ncbi:MAG: hypothetical protein WBR26_02965 [Candidatus Acidiferrum sp.]